MKILSTDENSVSGAQLVASVSDSDAQFIKALEIAFSL